MKIDRLLRGLRRLSPRFGNTLCLHYWRPKVGTNFGDELSYDIVGEVLKLNGEGATLPIRRCAECSACSRRLFSVGSILHDCKPGDIVWGSGINGKVSAYGYDFSSVDIRAVRGPLTREMVLKNGGACPEVYGDPALLLSHLFPELTGGLTGRPKSFDISVIPNINDMAFFPTDEEHRLRYNLISPYVNWQTIAEQVSLSDFVVSSSLHGIIFADVLGVKCRPMRSLFESLFKFEDYFLSTGRECVKFARNVTEAVQLGPMPRALFSGEEKLLSSFPMDIFLRSSV